MTRRLLARLRRWFALRPEDPVLDLERDGDDLIAQRPRLATPPLGKAYDRPPALRGF